MQVDEEGAEAAAATAIKICLTSAILNTPEFIVDHPFAFFIITKTGIPVFMGHVVKPESK